MPHTTRPGLRKRPKPPDELIAVAEKNDNKSDATNEANNVSTDNKPVNKSINGIKRVRLLTKKELFDELYEECKDKRKREKISFIVSFLYVLLNVGFFGSLLSAAYFFSLSISDGDMWYMFLNAR